MAARFWVGGTGTWDNVTTTHWSATSGGSGGASVPGPSDDVTIDASSGAGTITVATDFSITSLTCGAMGMTLDFSANNNSPTMSTFSCTGTGVRTLNMGSGTWMITGNNGVVFTIATTTNLTFNNNSGSVNFTYSGSTGERQILTGASAAFGLNNVNITAGTDSISLNSTFYVVNLNFTGFTGSNTNGAMNITGNLTMGTGMTQVSNGNTWTFTGTSGVQLITSNGVVFDRPITFNGVGGTFRFVGNFVTGSTRTMTLTNGTLDAGTNNVNVTCGVFSSSNSNTRTITMGSGTWTITGNNNTIWNTGTNTGLTISGSADIIFSYSGSVGTRSIAPGGLTVFSNNTGTLKITGGTDGFAINGTSTDFRSIDFTGYAGTFTAAGTTVNIRASLTFSTGMTMSATAAFVFIGTGSGGTITSNGKSFASNITFNQSGVTWVLGDALTTGVTNTITLTAGTFNANNFNVTCGLFSSSNSNTRSFIGGTGTMTLTGSSATVWQMTTTTGLTWSASNMTVVSNYSGSTGTRTFTFAGTNFKVGNFKVTAGSDIVSLNNIACSDLDFTGFTGTYTLTTNGTNVAGSLIFGTGMSVTSGSVSLTFSSTSTGNTITSNGVQANIPITFNGVGGTWKLQDDLNMDGASARTLTLTNGTFDANNKNITVGLFSSSNSNTRTLTMGSGTWTLTGNAATIWQMATSTNLTVDAGTSTVVLNYSGSTGTRTFNPTTNVTLNNVSVTGGTDTVGMATQCKNLDFTGFAGVLGTNGSNIQGNLTFGIGMTTTTSSSAWTYNGTTGTQLIDTKGIQWNVPQTINTTGSTVKLMSNLDITGANPRTLTITAGTFDANVYNISTALFSSSNSNTRSILMGSGTWTLTGTGTVWTTATTTGLTLTPGTSTIVINDTSATVKTFAGGGLTYAGITFSGDNIIVVNNNTFTNFRVANAGLTNGLLLTAGSIQSINGTFTNNGTAGNLTKLVSTSAGTPATLSKTTSIVNVDYMSIKDSTALGGATWYAGIHSTNVSGNTGWIFSTAPFTLSTPRDENRVPTLIAVANDGISIIPIYATTSLVNRANSTITTNKRLLVSNGTSGSDNGTPNAKRDGNYVPAIMGVSSADGITPVAIYADSTTNALLVKST